MLGKGPLQSCFVDYRVPTVCATPHILFANLVHHFLPRLLVILSFPHHYYFKALLTWLVRKCFCSTKSGGSHLYQAILKEDPMIIKLEFFCWQHLCNHRICPDFLTLLPLTEGIEEKTSHDPCPWSSPQSHIVTTDTFQITPGNIIKVCTAEQQGVVVWGPDKPWQSFHHVPDPSPWQATSLPRWQGRSADGSLHSPQQGISLLLSLATFSWCSCMAQI